MLPHPLLDVPTPARKIVGMSLARFERIVLADDVAGGAQART